MIKSAFAKLFDPKKRISYRRLLAWSTGTWLVINDHITSEDWRWVTGFFIAGEAVKYLSSPPSPTPPTKQDSI